MAVVWKEVSTIWAPKKLAPREEAAGASERHPRDWGLGAGGAKAESKARCTRRCSTRQNWPSRLTLIMTGSSSSVRASAARTVAGAGSSPSMANH
jgi:hypothetical protein